ncbi:protein transport protein S31 [Basidiobolus ranarum]|uniref:Protein transport protein SEC31 n=1 Tax=Basidiobolus ranarum TaxID=34480 RepID=A0ABR2W255_9FUNG
MKLKEINRTATVAWSPHQSQTYLATGTVSGALDASFSSTAELELFKLDTSNKADNVEPWKPTVVINSNARFNRIAWGAISEDKPHGIIAGGMENGELALWNAASILDNTNNEDALIMSNTNHTGSVRGLEFNPFQPSLLASAAGNGEIFIWDLTNPTKPYSPGSRSQRLDDITSLAWNNQVQHIMATSSTSGYTVVWDLKYRREVMHMAYPGISMGMGGRRGITAVAWNPDNATQLVTASEDDNNPVIMMWDLRNAHAPEKILSGHSKGILSLSWCKMDSELLLSTGKDCRTLCWNPRAGEVVGELPSSSNWTFDAQWSPKNPNLLSTASFDGKVNIFSLQARTSNSISEAPQVVNDDPFSAPNHVDSVTSSFQLRQAPKWLRPPVGATFSFGGQLVSFGNNASNSQIVSISTIITEPEIVKRSQELEAALESNHLQEFCEDKTNLSRNKKENDNWKILKILFESDARDRLIKHLGFDKDVLITQIAQNLSQLNVSEADTSKVDVSKMHVDRESEALDEVSVGKSPSEEGSAPAVASSLFDEDDMEDPLDFYLNDNVTDSASLDNEKPRPVRLPFKINSEENSDGDRLITRSITLGDFESAVSLCLKHDRLSDALILAVCGGGDLLARTREIYFERKSESTSYIRVLRSVVSGDLLDIVENADLNEWDEILATLCTYSRPENFASLCEKLGSRLESEWSKVANHEEKTSLNSLIHHASVCYLASGNIDKVISIWVAQEIEAETRALADQTSTRGQILQEFIEKITIFKKAIDYNDNSVDYQHTMTPLYQKYLEYVDILVSQGQLATAVKYLNYIPTQANGKAMYEAEKCLIIKDRIYHSGVAVGTMATPEFPFEFVNVDFEGESTRPNQTETLSSNDLTFAAPTITRDTGYSSAPQSTQQYYSHDNQYSYQSGAPTTAGPYSTESSFLTQTQQNYYTPSSHNLYQQQPSVPNYTSPNTFGNTNYVTQPIQAPSTPPVIPPSQQRNTQAWNDPPMATLSNAATIKQRAPTPKISPITSPFPNAASTPASPNSGYTAPPSRPNSGHGPYTQMGSNLNFIPKVSQLSAQGAPNSCGPSIPSIPNSSSSLPNYGAGYPTSSSPTNTHQPGIQRGPSPMTIQQPSNVIPPMPVSKPSSPAPAQPKYPPGDRSHIPLAYKPIYVKLNGEFQHVRQIAPANQKRMLDDVEKRLNLLFDALNIESLPEDIIEQVQALTEALVKRDFNTAQQIHLDLVTTQFAIVGQWMVGVKRLIELVRSHSGM